LTNKEPRIVNYQIPSEAAIFELQSCIEAMEKNAQLRKEKNFDERNAVIDFLEFQVIGRIEELLRVTAQPSKLGLLKYRAEKVKSALEEIDSNLFETLRANIRTGTYTGAEFKNLVSEYVGVNTGDREHPGEPGYDNLDLFINGLFSVQAMPEQTKDLEPEMVYYQKTPARIVFELAEEAHFSKEDVFVDIGAGLGQAAILVNLLTGIAAKGIEFEPAFCAYARDCASGLDLSKVAFIHADAREADYSEGTVFFMFTPFRGEMLREVLGMLWKESLKRKIKVITYGPCTAEVALQSWLHCATPQDDNMYKLAVFSSL